MRTTRWIERLLAVVGIVCLASAGATWLEAHRFQRQERRVLEGGSAHTARPAAAPQRPEGAAAIGQLDIPRLGVSVIVAPGDDERTLRKAVGHLPDTALPWEAGNTALAGHRDTFFRPLERVQIGDDIFFDTPRGRFHYRVQRTFVVEPDDVWVVAPSPVRTLTLITCFPFRYVGAAPKRFIVQARRV